MKNNYLFTTALLMGFVFSAKAAIVFTDITPDSVTSLDPSIGAAAGICKIDFDGDGIEEFNFRWDDYSTWNAGWYCHMTFQQNNEIILKGGTQNPFGAKHINALNGGDLIGTWALWGSSYPEPLIGDDSDPNFMGLGDKYIGVKFHLGPNIHYGWVLVSFDNNKTLTIKEYAYEDTPEMAILAGDKGPNAVQSLNSEQISVYPNPSSNFISIQNADRNIEFISFYSVEGKLILKQTIHSTMDKIDITALNNGIYYMVFESDNIPVGMQKIVKQ